MLAFEFLYKYLLTTFVIGGGFFIGFSLVSKFVYEPMLLKSEEDIEYIGLSEQEIKIKKYSKKYLEDYEELEYRDLDSDDYKSLQKSFIVEETPLGNVKMYYCHENESFIYWSEKQVPYRVLESVSKKYVIEYDCKTIYIDMEDELKKKHEELMETVNSSNDEDLSGNKIEEEKSSVFVTFKKYNTPNNNNIIEKTKKVMAGGGAGGAGGAGGKTTKNVIVCDKANRYSYRGVYDPQQDQKINVNKALEPKKISIQDFLKAKKKGKDCSGMGALLYTSDSSCEGAWRFLGGETTYSSEQPSGFFSWNRERFDTYDKLHKRVMEELVNTTNKVDDTVFDNSSDNSYDVLECDNNDDDKELVKILDKNDEDSDQVGDDDDVVESGSQRISRRDSVSSDERQMDKPNGMDKSNGSWLW